MIHTNARPKLSVTAPPAIQEAIPPKKIPAYDIIASANFAVSAGDAADAPPNPLLRVADLHTEFMALYARKRPSNVLSSVWPQSTEDMTVSAY